MTTETNETNRTMTRGRAAHRILVTLLLAGACAGKTAAAPTPAPEAGGPAERSAGRTPRGRLGRARQQDPDWDYPLCPRLRAGERRQPARPHRQRTGHLFRLPVPQGRARPLAPDRGGRAAGPGGAARDPGASGPHGGGDGMAARPGGRSPAGPDRADPGGHEAPGHPARKATRRAQPEAAGGRRRRPRAPLFAGSRHRPRGTLEVMAPVLEDPLWEEPAEAPRRFPHLDRVVIYLGVPLLFVLINWPEGPDLLRQLGRLYLVNVIACTCIGGLIRGALSSGPAAHPAAAAGPAPLPGARRGDRDRGPGRR